MTISSGNAAKLNKMNRAAKNVSLGTLLQSFESSIATLNGLSIYSGSYAATAADASASSITILTGATGLTGQIVQVTRSGSANWGYTPKIVNSGSNLTITSASPSWVIAAADKINWIAF